MKRFKAMYRGDTVVVLQILDPAMTGNAPDVVFVDSYGVLRTEPLLGNNFSECDVEMRSE